MPTIKGFTTKGDVMKQFKDAGVVVVLPFEAENFRVKKNPFKGLKLKDVKGKILKIKKKWLWL